MEQKPTQKLGLAELVEFFDEIFPQLRDEMVIEEVGPMRARLRMPVDASHLRPGGTVSGPAMFTLADCTFYAATLAMIGREPLTVTVSVSINFLRKPARRDLIGEARILKLGKRLSVGDVTLYSEGDDRPVAHAVMTYAIPPPDLG
ncbi:MAG: PaaI family thioesterase [Proteobacteria bacterium]|nr:PaaI family thioesterase [Pseudomonadota bacterium]